MGIVDENIFLTSNLNDYKAFRLEETPMEKSLKKLESKKEALHKKLAEVGGARRSLGRWNR
jgi:hypothetical protein